MTAGWQTGRTALVTGAARGRQNGAFRALPVMVRVVARQYGAIYASSC